TRSDFVSPRILPGDCSIARTRKPAQTSARRHRESRAVTRAVSGARGSPGTAVPSREDAADLPVMTVAMCCGPVGSGARDGDPDGLVLRVVGLGGAAPDRDEATEHEQRG